MSGVQDDVTRFSARATPGARPQHEAAPVALVVCCGEARREGPPPAVCSLPRRAEYREWACAHVDGAMSSFVFTQRRAKYRESASADCPIWQRCGSQRSAKANKKYAVRPAQLSIREGLVCYDTSPPRRAERSALHRRR